MIDHDKVIKGLECCIVQTDEFPPLCEECPYCDEKIGSCDYYRDILSDALALLKAQEPITGETSDGYHTFNELYHHRAVLFSVIVANYPDRAWKSKKHHDGTMYDNMFIVGIDTPDGQATYHYDVDPYWDMFACKVLENAPEWDGHTPAQAIERIGKLKAQESRVLTLDELTRERQLASLALWLADAVFEDDWDSNPEFYREIACRKLEKLGYVQVKDYGYVNTVTEMLSKALENMEKKEQKDEKSIDAHPAD